MMTRIHMRLSDRLIYISGLLTAETFALPYPERGSGTYSSGIGRDCGPGRAPLTDLTVSEMDELAALIAGRS